ncbi:MAG: cation transporter [Gammaproteobacteria bacterium]
MTPAARPAVELVYADDCPNVGAARGALLRACSMAGLDPLWREWRVDDARCPEHLKQLGSPTILVDGRDVAGASQPAAADCCRVYQHGGKLSGVPAVELIADALRNRTPSTSENDMKTLRLKIEGMHCGGCADTIQALLMREPGVKSATVSFSAGQGRVLYDPAATAEGQLLKAVEQAGYRARGDDRQPAP